MNRTNPKNSNNDDSTGRKSISVMGSTGSIGTQTLDIIAHYPRLFKVEALTACRNWRLLADQALRFRPQSVVIADEAFYPDLRDALRSTGIEVLAGEMALSHAATLPATDIVVGALVGYSGLASTIAALEAGKQLALANKETLVVGGEIINDIVKRKGKRILAVDSEHSAIFQCLMGEEKKNVSKLILTASGGPFLDFTPEELKNVTVEQALSHPNWHMGAKVTIDSATMMNKGFEMMEAFRLFDVEPEDIEISVHPESIVHSMVEFTDGSVKAQLGRPDMRLPIEVALAYPDRLDLTERMSMPRLDLAEIGKLTFRRPDFERFPLLRLAYEAAKSGGLVPALLNAANEVAVKAFLDRKIDFCRIGLIVEKTIEMAAPRFQNVEVSVETIAAAHNEGTEIARNFIK